MLTDAALLLAATGAVVIHRRGWHHEHRPDTTARHGATVWGFAVGTAVVLLALSGPLEAAAGRSFAWHMVQHQLLVLLAAPLIAVAAPLRRLWLGLTGGRRYPLGGYGDPGALALVAAVVAVGTLLAWHLPPLYDAAMQDPLVHRLEHATLVGSAVLFWAAVLHAARDDHRLGAAVVALAGTAIVGAALGVVLLTAPRSLYAWYAGGGATALEQQRVGGALMKVGALLVHAGAAVGLTLRWLHRLDEGPPAVAPR